MVGDAAPPETEASQIRRLQQFVAWLLPIITGFAFLETVAFVAFGDQPTAGMAGVLYAYAAVLVAARRQVRQGRLVAAVTTICAGILIADMITAVLQPALLPALAVVPLLAVAVALPYVSGAALRRLSVACWLVVIVVAALSAVSPVVSRLPDWYERLFHTSALAAAAGLVVLLLWQFSSRLTETLARTQAANAALRAAQAQLATEHERLAVTLRSIGDGVVATDAGGRVTLVNPVAEELTGWSEADAFGRPIDEVIRLVHEETRQPVANPIGAALRERAIVQLANHTALIARDGADRGIADSAAPIRDAAGRLHGAVLVFRDVTEQQRTSRARNFLAEAGAILATSLDYAATLEQVAQLATPALADWCVVDMVEADGALHRLAAVHADARYEPLMAQLRARPPDLSGQHPVVAALRTGEPIFLPDVTESTVRDAARDDEHAAIVEQIGLASAIVVPLHARGRTLGVIALSRGPAAQRYTEADLALAQELGHRAAIAVDNARLYADAQAAIRAREEFIAVASHELRTPLASTKGYGQLLARMLRQSAFERDKVATIVDAQQRQMNRLEALLDDLLDMTRLQQGRLELRRQPVDLAALAREALARFDDSPERSPAHDLVLEAPEPVVGEWDPARLDQVLTNLISNALKYSPTGGEVRVRVERGDGQARIAVSDQGIGISPDEQATMFRAFSRAASAAGNFKGIGLGLYIAAEIVKGHGGTIDLESQAGGGATFTVWLPLSQGPAARAESAAQGGKDAAGPN